jgi:hypothetical protein
VIGPRWGIVNPMVQPNGYDHTRKINRVGVTIHKKQKLWHAVIQRVIGGISLDVMKTVKKLKNKPQ